MIDLENRKNWEAVFNDELHYILRSRKERLSSDIIDQRYYEEELNKFAPSLNLTGLALSGGGIRSATFSLGALHVLKEKGLLNQIDYLSTVSGGGYIGGWLSANCKRSASKKWLDKETDWDKSIRHLRDYSNYLSPKIGFFSADTWSMLTIWMRNTLLIQFMIVLASAALLILPLILFLIFEELSEPAYGPLTNAFTILFYIIATVGIALNLLRINQQDNWFLNTKNWGRGLLTVAACLLIIFFGFQGTLTYTPKLTTWILIALLMLAVSFLLLPSVPLLIKSCMNIFTKKSIKNNIFKGNNKGKTTEQNNGNEQFNYSQILVQLLIVIPALVAGFMFSIVLLDIIFNLEKISSEQITYKKILIQTWKILPLPLVLTFSSLWLFSFISVRKPLDKEKWLTTLLAPVPALIVLYAILSGIILLIYDWGQAQKHTEVFVWSAPLLMFSFSIAIIMLIGMLGRSTTEGVREWWSRLGAWIVIYGFSWIVIVCIAVYGPDLYLKLLETKSVSGLSLSWIVTTVAGLVAGNSQATSGDPSKTLNLFKELIAKLAPFVFIAGLLLIISTLLRWIIDYIWHHQLDLVSDNWKFFYKTPELSLVCLFTSIGVGVFILSWRVDINVFSLNAFYRSRLVRCYLGASRPKRNPQKFTGFDDGDDLKLAALGVKNLNCPLHIVNCALNLGGSKDLSLKTRHSANFTLTPFNCGSSYLIKDQLDTAKTDNAETNNTIKTCYKKTNLFGGEEGQPTLGQAISVSGAAANPNMGYHTSPVVAFLMTLFNLRLGWWFPNPTKPQIDRPSPKFSLRYLINELFGIAKEKSDFLAISDGGHFENLAAYELIKRRCKVIIISDCECDPKMQFEGLGKLIRLCEVDLKTTIDIDVGSIRPSSETNWSKQNCAVGKIHYPENNNTSDENGWLIYLKASMNGFESTPIMQYKATHPDFPHETTGDQFYGEDQFESYRALGKEITERVLKKVIGEHDIVKVAKTLYKSCAPSLPNVGRFTDHADRLMDLWAELGRNADLKNLDNELFNNWSQITYRPFRSIFYLCSEMIQLMENVYLDLSLEETWEHPDNQGWKRLFKKWANSEYVQKTWEISKNTYGDRFNFFWERNFGKN